MATGTVKWFNEAQGFGYIETENGEEVFVRDKAVLGARSLRPGQRVEFDIVQKPRGQEASNVKVRK